MMIQTSTLIGPTLDWAVAMALGLTNRKSNNGLDIVCFMGGHVWHAKHPNAWRLSNYSLFRPTTDWSIAGPIIDRENIWLTHNVAAGMHGAHYGDDIWFQKGNTPLIAAMRCFVLSKLGKEVYIPEGLT